MRNAFVLFYSLLLACFVSAGVEPLNYTPVQAKTAQEIITKLSEHHYRKLELDDKLSARLFDNYTDSLDPLKSYLTLTDIDELEAYKLTLDDALLDGNLTPGFDIYNRFRTRMSERLTSNVALLESDYKFDFEKPETIEIDADNRLWAPSQQISDDYWRKRVKDALLRLTLSGKELTPAKGLLIKRYKNQINQLNQQDNEDAFQFFINALTEIYDPHTSYLSPRMLENFNIAMSLSLEGIGAVLQKEDEFTKVVRIVPAGPADKESTLRAGDKIVSVAQGENGELVDVIGWRLDEVVDLIRGKKDTLVRLEIISGASEVSDKSQVVSIVREKVRLEEQAAQSEILEVPVDDNKYRFGVIKIPTFYMDFEAYRKRDPNFKSTTRDVQKLLIELQQEHVEGIILDLRNNGGGSLLEATALTDLFINPGPVVQIRHANQRISRDQRSRRKPFYDGPLIVLVNRLSASASEIFAGAIQDYGRALVIGSASFGKGTVQVMAPLKQGQLKFTESKFYRVSGNSTQHRGVIPDIEFPSYYSQDDIGESSQEYALPWDSIHAVKHTTHHLFGAMIPNLQAKHESRVSKEPEWQFMLDEIKLIEAQ
ncbi:MAG: carboxy terminal-processing peptidase, partial [Porticoccaceae bacterium]|nr:carboxy terminal-processing peptidase [Porticoccaceae bacterium]